MLRTMAASLARACAGGGAPPAAAAVLSSRRPINAPVRRFGLGSHTSNNDPDVLEREKARNLSARTAEEGERVPGSMPGGTAPGWNERLASDAEAVVKAERAPDVGVEELVRLSVEQAKQATAEAEEEAAAAAAEEAAAAAEREEEGPGAKGAGDEGKGGQ
jgi:hypothetical protein